MNRTTILASAALTLAAAGLLFAGPLNPPAGPVTSTYKTLTEVEPRIAINLTNTPGDANSLFKITQPGSYYLTGNVTGVVGKHGIEVAASGVTLDLMGFDLSGIAGMGAFDGVTTSVANLTNITIRNGSVRGWRLMGVNLSNPNLVTNCAIIDVRASGNGANGIMGGTGGTITGCSASNNTANGITAEFATITGCTANNNNTNGIGTGNGCTITGCSANNNSTNGISIGNGCAITDCSANNNSANGISASTGCTIIGCSVYANGINLVGPGCTITGCSAAFSTADGISASNGGCTITGCLAYSNSGSGISAGFGCTISNCTARVNALDGIVVAGACTVLANTCSTNGSPGNGAGIHATSNDNRIEGNTCTDADRGIDINAAGNIIIKNTCSGNTIDWVIAANNVFGPIIDRRVPASPAVSGFTAFSTLASTDPNANFSY